MPERLLIVEDEDTLCESLKRVFMRDGYEVDIAYSGEAALVLMEERSYDVIITDIILPGISGIELLRKYKTRKPEQKFIIMTAYANLESAVEALRFGANDYLTKPLTHEEIKKSVRDTINGKPRTS